jgi:YD repeat-containing protein
VFDYPAVCQISLRVPGYFPGRYGLVYYEISSSRIRKESEETDWDTGLKEFTSYQYNSYGQLTQKSSTNSNGDQMVENISHISDCPGSSTDHISMKNQHIYSPVIEKNIMNNTKNIYRELNSYSLIGSTIGIAIGTSAPTIGIYGIRTKQIAETGGSDFDKNYAYSSLFTSSSLNVYKINEIKETNNIATSVFYGFNNTLPVVKAENLDISTLYEKIVASLPSGYPTLESLIRSITALPNTNWTAFNKKLRDNVPKTCQVTTYSYQPLIGMTLSTDPSGTTVYYEYDDFGRLKCIRNDDGKILKTFDYHYIGQTK